MVFKKSSFLGLLLLFNMAYAAPDLWLSIGRGVRVEQGTSRVLVVIGAPVKIIGSSVGVYCLGSSVLVSGNVNGDVVCIAGNVRVFAGAAIQGRACAWGGNVVVDEGGQVKGVIEQYAPRTYLINGHIIAQRLQQRWEHWLKLFFFWLSVAWYGVCWLAGLLLWTLRPQLPEVLGRPLMQTPGKVLQWGLGVGLLGLLVLVLLCISIIGLVFLPGYLLLLLVLGSAGWVVGLTVLVLRIGTRWHLGSRTALTLGLVSMDVLSLLPWVGFGIMVLVSLLGTGSLLLYGRQRKALAD